MTQNKKYRAYAICLLGILAILGTLFLLLNFLNDKVYIHSVVLKSNGFEPSTLTIKKNDIVRFTTARTFPFWPASDKHPSHSEYPDFDPRKPILQNETWEFKFEKVGTWAYHDHTNSSLRGVIYVIE